jgi:hypothetical protein
VLKPSPYGVLPISYPLQFSVHISSLFIFQLNQRRTPVGIRPGFFLNSL